MKGYHSVKLSRYYFNLGCRIAILSDIHDKAFDLSLLVKEKVDLILVPGDICSDHLSEEAWEQTDKAERSLQWRRPNVALSLFQKLPKIAPTFFSMGNHESRWTEKDKQIVRESGTVLLDNDYCRFNGILLGGISSFSRHRASNQNDTSVRNLIEKMKKEEGRKILLLHEPQLYDEYELQNQPIDLIASGHAHGGQWRFFGQGIFAPGQGFLPKYTKGVYNDNLLVSAGMTNTAAPIPRIFNPTEIVIVEPIKERQ